MAAAAAAGLAGLAGFEGAEESTVAPRRKKLAGLILQGLGLGYRKGRA